MYLGIKGHGVYLYTEEKVRKKLIVKELQGIRVAFVPFLAL